MVVWSIQWSKHTHSIITSEQQTPIKIRKPWEWISRNIRRTSPDRALRRKNKPLTFVKKPLLTKRIEPLFTHLRKTDRDKIVYILNSALALGKTALFQSTSSIQGERKRHHHQDSYNDKQHYLPLHQTTRNEPTSEGYASTIPAFPPRDFDATTKNIFGFG